MIFIGDGALLQQAIASALERHYHVDGVLGNTEQLQSFRAQRNIPFRLARNAMATPEWISEQCRDGIGFSIDNSLLLPKAC